MHVSIGGAEPQERSTHTGTRDLPLTHMNEQLLALIGLHNSYPLRQSPVTSVVTRHYSESRFHDKSYCNGFVLTMMHTGQALDLLLTL